VKFDQIKIDMNLLKNRIGKLIILMVWLSPVSLYAQSNQPDTLSQVREYRIRQGLPNFFRKLQARQPVTIAYLGGSITYAGGGYREQSAAWLQKQYPGAKISAINAGISGTGSDLANFRLGKQVLAFNPDLVFVEFAVNDQSVKPETIHETMEGIVRQIWKKNPQTDICFLYTMTGDMAPVLKAGKLPVSAKAMEDVAEYYHIPSIDMCLGVVALASQDKLVFKGRRDEFPDKMVFSADNIHPYPETGHRLYTEAIARSLTQIAAGVNNAKYSHISGKPYTQGAWEQAQMIAANELKKTGKWNVVPSGTGNANALTPNPFPVLLRSDSVGSSLVVTFEGTMIGLYDVVGPGTGQYEVVVDGGPAKLYSRFDSYATTWRAHYFILPGLIPGKHTVQIKVSATLPDKKAILKQKADDVNLNPEKYRDNAGYAAYLLLVGKLIK
jgi:hypothetical protein